MLPNQYGYYDSIQPQMNYNQQYYGGYPYTGYPSSMQQNYYGGYQQQQYNQNYNPYPYQNMYNQPNYQNQQYYGYGQQPQQQINTSDPSRDDFVYVPGRISAPQFEDSKGNSVNANEYVQGGKSVIDGGYNPVTGAITPSAAVQGNFEPFNNGMAQHYQFGVPRFNGSVSMQQYQNPYMNYYNNYNNGFGNPQQSMYSYANNGLMNPLFRPINGIPINDFNSYVIYESLYNDDGIDIRSELSNIILTDEEREKAEQNRFAHSGVIVGYDYFNQPIYSSSYGNNNNIQNDFEQARERYVDHYMMCSEILHSYEGDVDKMDRDKLRKRYDPFKNMQQNNQNMINGFNTTARMYSASQNERDEYAKDLRIIQTWQMDTDFNRAEYTNQVKRQMMQKAFADIKASHDAMLGIEPGQSYDLATYLDNGYKIGIAMAKQQAKKSMRNGRMFYSSNSYRAALAKKSGRPVRVDSMDDEYIPIEVSLKEFYSKNKEINNILITSNGTYTIETKKKSELTPEDIRHINFMKEAQKMKDNDDARRAKEGWR